MTAIWGPLGWMSLHSIATSYSEFPTPSEKQLMSSWLDLFRDTITCHYCKGHFTELLEKYRKQFPDMLDSRHAFAMFSFRAHNAVNRRLNKPIYGSVEECVQTLRDVIKLKPAREYRVAYLNHIARYWKSLQDVNGIVALRKIQEMRKIEEEYVRIRDTGFTVDFRPDIVVLPNAAVEKPTATALPPNRRVGITFQGGLIRLRK
jgi:hypothetical protein